jgi:hypothetical protein
MKAKGTVTLSLLALLALSSLDCQLSSARAQTKRVGALSATYTVQGSGAGRYNLGDTNDGASGSDSLYVCITGQVQYEVWQNGTNLAFGKLLSCTASQSASGQEHYAAWSTDAQGNVTVNCNTNHAGSGAADPSFNQQGSGTSTLQNVSYVYSNAGTFSVTLAAVNEHGTSVQGIGPSNIVTTLPTVKFTANPTNGDVPLLVQFSAPGASATGRSSGSTRTARISRCSTPLARRLTTPPPTPTPTAMAPSLAGECSLRPACCTAPRNAAGPAAPAPSSP